LITLKAGGDSGTTLTVHETIIKENSPFFCAALDKKWKEGQLREIELPEDQPKTVSAYVEWLYSKNIDVVSTQKLDDKDRNLQFDNLAALYVFGEKIQNTRFKNAAITAILTAREGPGEADKPSANPDVVAVKTIYDGTMAESLARKLMVHIYVEGGWNDWTKKDSAQHHPDFLLDLVRAFMDKRSPPSLRGLFEARFAWLEPA
jgi:hypothetical protein